MLGKIVVLVILVLINGMFSATEMAFMELNTYDLNK